MSYQILPNDNDCYTCRSNVLLCACINQTELGNVDFFGQNARRHICYQQMISYIRNFVVVCSVNGVVIAYVYVVYIFTDIFLLELRNVREVLVCRTCQCTNITELLSFFICFLRPVTGNDIVCLLGLGQQVNRNHGELQCPAALQEQYIVVIRNVHQISQILLRIIDDFLEFRRSVAHLHYGFAGSFIVQHLSSCLLQYLFRKGRRTCREINCTIAHWYLPPVN